MAIFLLLYVIFVLAWVVWAGVLMWHVYKYHFPDDNQVKAYLISFFIISVSILFVSFIFISRADWVTVPTLMKGL